MPTRRQSKQSREIGKEETHRIKEREINKVVRCEGWETEDGVQESKVNKVNRETGREKRKLGNKIGR